MKKREFEIVIEETLSRVVKVFATSDEEATNMVEEMYKSEEIILDDSDLMETKIFEINTQIN